MNQTWEKTKRERLGEVLVEWAVPCITCKCYINDIFRGSQWRVMAVFIFLFFLFYVCKEGAFGSI